MCHYFPMDRNKIKRLKQQQGKTFLVDFPLSRRRANLGLVIFAEIMSRPKNIVPIPRITEVLTPAQFKAQFVDKSQPCILEYGHHIVVFEKLSSNIFI